MTRTGNRTGLFLLALVVSTWIVAMVLLLLKAGTRTDPGSNLLVVFSPEMARIDVVNAIHNAEGAILRDTAFDTAWFVRASGPGFHTRVKGEGAFVVLGMPPYVPVTLGCFPGASTQKGSTNLPLPR